MTTYHIGVMKVRIKRPEIFYAYTMPLEESGHTKIRILPKHGRIKSKSVRYESPHLSLNDASI